MNAKAQLAKAVDKLEGQITRWNRHYAEHKVRGTVKTVAAKHVPGEFNSAAWLAFDRATAKAFESKDAKACIVACEDYLRAYRVVK